jgi:hypothetical protein
MGWDMLLEPSQIKVFSLQDNCTVLEAPVPAADVSANYLLNRGKNALKSIFYDLVHSFYRATVKLHRFLQ